MAWNWRTNRLGAPFVARESKTPLWKLPSGVALLEFGRGLVCFPSGSLKTHAITARNISFFMRAMDIGRPQSRQTNKGNADVTFNLCQGAKKSISVEKDRSSGWPNESIARPQVTGESGNKREKIAALGTIYETSHDPSFPLAIRFKSENR